MKAEAMAVLVLAREKAKASKPKPSVPVFATPVAKDDGREAWTRFKSECVLLTKKGGVK